jgi:hypothetical protein
MNASGCAAQAVQIVSVGANPVLSTTLSASTVCPGNKVIILAGGASTYSWNTGATTSSIAPTISVTTTFTVKGLHLGVCSTASVFTVNAANCTGISESESDNLDITYSPNPSNGTLIIKSVNDVTIEVSDLNGRSLLILQIIEGKNIIDMNILQNGIYFLKAKNSTVKYKLVKE